MIGAIIGDVAGSRFERVNNYKGKDFALFASGCRFTDDSVMTLAIAKALTLPYMDMEELSSNAIKCMRELGAKHPRCGFGHRFRGWLAAEEPKPYYSYGNGAAMRISPVGFAARTVEEAKALSLAVTKVTHDHPEGLKGAEAVAVAIVLARQGKSKQEIKDYICRNYYDIGFKLDDIRKDYRFDVSCQGSVPQAFEAFFEGTDFEDTVRNAVSIGGDSDTIAAIAGSVAEAYFGVPEALEVIAYNYLYDDLKQIYDSCKGFNKIIKEGV